MKIEDQVVTLELAREMKELGAEQDSAWYWIQSGKYADDWSESFLELKEDMESHNDQFYCSAYTVAELGEMLPHGHWESGKVAIDSIFFCGYVSDTEALDGMLDITKYSNQEANARAKMWIYLKKEGLMKK